MFFKAFLSFILSPLVLLLGTSSAFAAESCRLFVSTPVDQTALSVLGYKVQVSPGLTDGIISLRTHTDQGFALIRTAAQDHLYFEIDDSAGNRPILRLTYPAKGLVSCKAVQARMEKLRQDRLQILPAVRYLKSPDNASFLEAVLALEKRAFALKGKPFEVDREWLGRVLSLAARDGLARGTDFFLRLNQMRASLIRNALSSYCREKTTLAELSTDKCTNCVGQTALWLAALMDAHWEPPQGWQFGFAVYSDHLQPVLFHNGKKAILDLVSLEATKVSEGVAILPPAEFIRLGLRKNKELVWPTDGLQLDNMTHLHGGPRFWEKWLGLKKSGSTVKPAPGDEERVDALSYDGVDVSTAFGTGDVPQRADLRGLAEREYQNSELAQDLNLPVSTKPSLKPSLAQKQNLDGESRALFQSANLRDLLPEERADYERIVRRKVVEPADVARYGLHNLPFEQPFNAYLVRPFQLSYQEGLTVPFQFIDGDDDQLTFVTSDSNLIERLKPLPLVARYRLLLEEAKKQWQGELKRTVQDLFAWLSKGDLFAVPEDLPARLVRLKLALERFGLRGLIQDPIGLAPLIKIQIEGLEPIVTQIPAALKKMHGRLGVDHREILRQAENVSPEKMITALLFLEQLGHSSLAEMLPDSYFSYFGTYRSWRELTRPLMLGLLYDRKFLYSAPLMPGERVERQSLQAIESPPVSPFDFKGPDVNLPSAGLSCAEGEFGWIQRGAFTVKCPDSKKQAAAAGEIRVRPLREVRADLLAGLIALNSEIFFHPGNLLLLHEMWSETLQNELERGLIGFLTAPFKDFESNQIRMSNISALQRFSAALLKTAPQWLSQHANYAPAFALYQRAPKAWFESHEILTGMSGTLTGPNPPSPRIWATSGNPTLSVQEFLSQSSGKVVFVTLKVSAQIGERQIQLVIEDNGKSIFARNKDLTKAESWSSNDCRLPLPIPLSDGDIYMDQMEVNCYPATK